MTEPITSGPVVPARREIKHAGRGYVNRMRRTLTETVDLLTSPLVHERATRNATHRPWPMPPRSWIMAQTWIDLLFVHWRVPPEALEPAVPAPLALQTWDGGAWLAVTPFEVRNLRLRGTLPVPFLSAFAEINVRTYVVYDEKPGIYFFSLDAASRVAVAAARRFYRLPYFNARMSIDRRRGSIAFSSQRREAPQTAPAVGFQARYSPAGPPSAPGAETLEHWLTERYCLYTLDDHQHVWRAEIHHRPWPLQAADADIELNTMPDEVGVLPDDIPLLHYAGRQDVVFWSLEPAG